jgi:hypothetical protein
MDRLLYCTFDGAETRFPLSGFLLFISSFRSQEFICTFVDEKAIARRCLTLHA